MEKPYVKNNLVEIELIINDKKAKFLKKFRYNSICLSIRC
jgi:hypothetical protein